MLVAYSIPGDVKLRFEDATAVVCDLAKKLEQVEYWKLELADAGSISRKNAVQHELDGLKSEITILFEELENGAKAVILKELESKI